MCIGVVPVPDIDDLLGIAKGVDRRVGCAPIGVVKLALLTSRNSARSMIYRADRRRTHAPINILDCDTTIKPLYVHQEEAVVSFNPKKPGRDPRTRTTRS